LYLRQGDTELFNPRLLWKKDKKRHNGCVGLECSPEGVAICHVEYGEEGHVIAACSFLPHDANIAQSEQIAHWLDQHDLQGMPCHYVLHPAEYELLLLDAPDVDDNELNDAVQWRVKDLISRPMHDVIVQVFQLPADAYRGRMKMIYVAVVERSVIKNRLRLIREGGLRPHVIDITELALLNVARFLPEMSHQGVGLLRLRSSGGLMMLGHRGDMYFTRTVETGLQGFGSPTDGLQLSTDAVVDNLSLEIQRSLDYYETQLGKGMVNRMYVLPLKRPVETLFDDLNRLLPLPIIELDANHHLPISSGVEIAKTDQAFCMACLGAALRRLDAAAD
jgi:MSHA biogenesis protein MshI